MNTPTNRGFQLALLYLLLPVYLLAFTAPGTEGDTTYWSLVPTAGLFFSQQSYSEHYKGGGVNSIAMGHHFDLDANYKKGNNHWENQLRIRYGLIKVANNPMQKNEDHFEINSKYGHSFSEHLQVTGLFNFTTRMHDVYQLNKSGEKGALIGNFLAPAYVHLGSGIDYLTKDKALSIFYTPLNSKVTIVNDPALRAQYLGGDASHEARYELGSLLKFVLKKKIMENITIHSTGTFFTNHLDNFGAIDVNLENKLNFKVNKFFSVNLLTHIIYDEDILFELGEAGENAAPPSGPRTQFREVLNIGLSHTF